MQVRIIHTNDRHGDRKYALHRASVIRRLRDNHRGNILVADGGDFGKVPSMPETEDSFNERQRVNRATMQEMDFENCEIAVPGDHDLENGIEEFRATVKKSSCKFLAANVTDSEGRSVEPIKSNIIREMEGGIKISFIGLVNQLPKFRVSQKVQTPIAFSDPLKALDETLSETNGKVHFSIVLAHLGIKYQKEIARKYPNIPVIIAGHSHHLLWNGMRVNNTLIAQAGGDHGKHVGVIDLEIENGKVCDSISEVYDVTSKQINPDLELFRRYPDFY